MDIFLIITLTIIITALIALVILLKRKIDFRSDIHGVFNSFDPVNDGKMALNCFHASNITIPIEQLPATTKFEEKNLYEITDAKIIARITETVPNVAEAVAKTITNKALKNVELYKAVIPSGATLAESKQMEGAVRGFYRGAKGIKGQANLVKVDPTKISKASKVANGVANVMNVGSLVVGQYYMSEINSKIEDLSKSVNKISDFQDREFKSRILSLIALVGKISNFSSEILESDDLRNRKLHTLDNLEGEGTQLLQQVNLSIDEIIKRNQTTDYSEYQEKVDDFGLLLEYQKILMTILEEISKLTYLLGKGQNSSEMCYSIFKTYQEQSDQIRVALEEWHKKQVQVHGIDIDKNRRNRKGFGGFVASIPGVFYDDLNYRGLEDGLGQKIDAQIAPSQLQINVPEEVYNKDIQIIIKDGKYYYLHDELNGY
ncbi:MAG: topoisomerase IV [Lachnospiraceae bacterium]|nr:topoisomerase IV [Lachnospiraceae bacterium]